MEKYLFYFLLSDSFAKKKKIPRTQDLACIVPKFPRMGPRVRPAASGRWATNPQRGLVRINIW